MKISTLYTSSNFHQELQFYQEYIHVEILYHILNHGPNFFQPIITYKTVWKYRYLYKSTKRLQGITSEKIGVLRIFFFMQYISSHCLGLWDISTIIAISIFSLSPVGRNHFCHSEHQQHLSLLGHTDFFQEQSFGKNHHSIFHWKYQFISTQDAN